MNVFDLIILAILAALTLRGIWKGMVSQIVSVASIIVCWVVATRFGSLVAPTIPVEPPWDQVLAMGIVFAVAWIATRFAYAALEKLIKHWRLEKLNKLLGGALGFAKGLLLCMIITFFSVMLSETSRDVVFNSQSGFHMVRLITQIGVFVPKNSYEFVHTQLDNFKNKVDAAVPGQTPAMIQVQSSEPMQQLLGQMHQTTETTKSAGSLLTALSQWWNGTKDEPRDVQEVVNPVVQAVAAQTAGREESRPSAATYVPPPPPMLPQIPSYTDIPPSAAPLTTPQPQVAVGEYFIRRAEAPAPPAMQQLAPLATVPSVSQPSLPPLTTLAPLSESFPIPPEPMALLPAIPVPNHIGSDLLLRNSTLPASSNAPASVFRP